MTMHLIDILIIAACLGVGYWIVSSIMGKGVDSKDGDARRAPRSVPGSSPPATKDAPAPRLPPPPSAAPPTYRPPGRSAQPWHVVLDIPRDASARDIEAARRRRMAAAESAGDSFEVERIRRAAEEALKQVR
jgi:hypothetical protein